MADATDVGSDLVVDGKVVGLADEYDVTVSGSLQLGDGVPSPLYQRPTALSRDSSDGGYDHEGHRHASRCSKDSVDSNGGLRHRKLSINNVPPRRVTSLIDLNALDDGDDAAPSVKPSKFGLKNLGQTDAKAMRSAEVAKQMKTRSSQNTNTSERYTQDRQRSLSMEDEHLKKTSSTAMRDEMGRFWGRICQFLFKGVTIEQDRLTDLKEAADEGTLVYVVRCQSILFYLLLNFLLLRYHLPLARTAPGMSWTPSAPFQALVRGAGRAVSPLVPSFLRRALPWKAEIPEDHLMGELLRRDLSVVVFLQKPETWWGGAIRMIWNLLRDFFLAVLGFCSHHKDRDTVEELIRIQRTSPTPIFLAPQVIVWDRAPTKATKAPFTFWSFLDWTFGEREAPSFMRELFLFFRDRRHTQVRGGKPINLQAILEQHRNQPEERVAAHVRALLTKQLDREIRVVTGPVLQPVSEIKAQILESPNIVRIIREVAEKEQVMTEVVEERGKKILDKMCADYKIWVLRAVGVVLRWIFQRLFEGIYVDESGLKKVREANLKAPIVLIPCHKSHADYLLLSYVFFHYDMVTPLIAAGENLSIPVVGWLFSHCGAFFIRRQFGSDLLYRSIFTEYVLTLITNGHSLEFFIEGGRSRNGKVCRPKMGMLSICLDAVQQGRVDDLYVVPTHIGYDRIIEGKAYSKELMGQKKEKESLSAIFRARKILNFNFGNAVVTFSEPISVKNFVASALQKFDPSRAKEKADVYCLRSLAHRVVYAINEQSVAMVTALVATVILTNPTKGLTRRDLIARVLWLRREIVSRDGQVAPISESDIQAVVDRTLHHLKSILKLPPATRTLEPLVLPRESRRLELAYYRNQVIHMFISEGVVALAVWAHKDFRLGVPKSILLDQGRFLSQLLKMEFTYTPGNIEDNFERAIESLTSRGSLMYTDESGDPKVCIPEGGEALVAFLCRLLYPFVDSYWVAALSLLSMTHGDEVLESDLLKRMQMVAETLYHEGRLFYIEAASNETLKNALVLLEDWKFVSRRPDPAKPSVKRVKLIQDDDHTITDLIDKIGRYRDVPHVDVILENAIEQSNSNGPDPGSPRTPTTSSALRSARSFRRSRVGM